MYAHMQPTTKRYVYFQLDFFLKISSRLKKPSSATHKNDATMSSNTPKYSEFIAERI